MDVGGLSFDMKNIYIDTTPVTEITLTQHAKHVLTGV
jgi:hypothetical protein